MADSRTKTDGFLVEFGPGPLGETVVIEDDRNTAYAYLLNADKEIVGDVWLYNHGKAPQFEPWRKPTIPPFANPEAFVRSDELFSPPTNSDEFSIEWQPKKLCSADVAILLNGELFAALTSGSRPGWSRLALVDGPLAGRLAVVLPNPIRRIM